MNISTKDDLLSQIKQLLGPASNDKRAAAMFEAMQKIGLIRFQGTNTYTIEVSGMYDSDPLGTAKKLWNQCLAAIVSKDNE